MLSIEDLDLGDSKEKSSCPLLLELLTKKLLNWSSLLYIAFLISIPFLGSIFDKSGAFILFLVFLLSDV